MAKTICHITTVHQAKDMRIFYKECVSLAKAGFKLKLIVINGESEIADNVEIIGVSCSYNSKFSRFLKAGKAAYKKAIEVNADAYHFHDPEFLWYAYQLKRKGYKVTYDVHEDVPVQILSKAWIPKIFRTFFSFCFRQFENLIASKLSGVVTVTDFIENRFLKINTNTITAKNYPILSMLPTPGNWHEKKNQICYIGDITRVRGIIEMINSLEKGEVRLALGGKFSQQGLREQAISLNGWKQVIEYGYVDRATAKQILTESKIGFVLLHPIENYQDALPVKLFEFMAAGIPVIVSNLRLQKELIESIGCGIVVDVFNKHEIQNAIHYLINNEAIAKEMGMKGREAVEKIFNWNKEEQKLVNYYTSLLK